MRLTLAHLCVATACPAIVGLAMACLWTCSSEDATTSWTCDGFTASFPTVSTMLRADPSRSLLCWSFSVSATAMVACDLGFFRLFGALAEEVGAPPLAALNVLALAAGLLSFPALIATLATNPLSRAHTNSAIAWAVLRILYGAFVLPLLAVHTPGRFTAARVVFGLVVAAIGGKCASEAGGGDMPGNLETTAVFGLLAFQLGLVPEGARVRVWGGSDEVKAADRYRR